MDLDYAPRPHVSPRRQYLGRGGSFNEDQAWGPDFAGAGGYELHQSTILERPSRTPSPLTRRRRATTAANSSLAPPSSQSWQPPNHQLPLPQQGIMKQPQVQPAAQQQRRGGGRKLPATPTKPSTLNIDALSTSMGMEGAAGGLMSTLTNTMSINFPKLEPSPTRAKAILQGIRKAGGARLPEVTSTIRRTLPIRQAVGTRWSRSLDDPVTFEEAVIAGRGTRQLPMVGPQQLMQQGVGRGRGSILRRELPRPGTTIVISTSHSVTNNGLVRQRYSESEDDEDWC